MVVRMMKYALAVALIASLGLAGALFRVMQDNASLTTRNASLTRSVASLKQARDQAQEARKVALAHLKRERARSAEFDRFRETLLKGGKDEDLPDWFLTWVTDLVGGVRRETP